MGKSRAILLTVTFLACALQLRAQTAEVCSKHLKVQESTQQHWNPGVVRDNSEQAGGEIYQVKIKIRKGGYINFEKLIIENQLLDVEVKQNGNRNATGPFKKGEEVTLIARTNKQKTFGTPDEAIISKLKSKAATAAILYTQKDKKYLHTLSDFKVSPSNKPIQ